MSHSPSFTSPWVRTTRRWRTWTKDFASFGKISLKRRRRAPLLATKKTWVDVEADEATFDKRDMSQDPAVQHLVVKKSETIKWGSGGGGIQRGRPRTLVLRKLIPKLTVKRAPGPGAIRKTKWSTVANELLLDLKVIRHTGSAKSYKAKVRGVLHDKVVHCKKRVKVNGKLRWLNPKYVGIVTHKIPGTQETLKVKSGTQIIDRAWRFLKDRIAMNQHCKAGSSLLRGKLRSAQREYRFKNQDLWLACGDLCRESLRKFYK
ncbi:unnamed protein product [Symbiodinium sp. CCMP2456]|nr:unnamed protein product [Symbiodinium sp. CCMP2456]